MSFEVERLAPASVLRPDSLDELAVALSNANTAGKSVIPWGGGTRMHVGNMPSGYDLAVDLTSLPASIEHVSGDMVCIVSANAKVSEVQLELAKAGQRLPFDVPSPSAATIGGSLASNVPGRMRSFFGGMRDWVIGLKVMLPDGTVTKSGGRVVKNVQGFDLHRLHTGAFGTLGIIIEAGFKLVPVAHVERTVAAWFEDLSTAREYAMSLFNGPFMPEALTLVTGDPAIELTFAFGSETGQQGTGYLVLARMAGFENAVDRMVGDATGLSGTRGATGYLVAESGQAVGAWQQVSESSSAAALALRAATRPSDAFALINQVERDNADSAGTDFSAILDVGFGGLHMGFRSPDEAALSSSLDAASRRIHAIDAGFVIERAPTAVKAEHDVFAGIGANIDVMRRLKHQFDPNGTLNRGRFAGGV